MSQDFGKTRNSFEALSNDHSLEDVSEGEEDDNNLALNTLFAEVEVEEGELIEGYYDEPASAASKTEMCDQSLIEKEPSELSVDPIALPLFCSEFEETPDELGIGTVLTSSGRREPTPVFEAGKGSKRDLVTRGEPAPMSRGRNFLTGLGYSERGRVLSGDQVTEDGPVISAMEFSEPTRSVTASSSLGMASSSSMLGVQLTDDAQTNSRLMVEVLSSKDEDFENWKQRYDAFYQNFEVDKKKSGENLVNLST